MFFLNYFKLFIFCFKLGGGGGAKAPSALPSLAPSVGKELLEVLPTVHFFCYLFWHAKAGKCLCKLCHYFPVAIHDSGSSS